MLNEQERLKLYSEASTRPWYFDGRDIFTTGSTEETGGHRLVIPLPNTLHPTQQVTEADAKLVVMAVNEHELLCELAEAARRCVFNNYHVHELDVDSWGEAWTDIGVALGKLDKLRGNV